MSGDQSATYRGYRKQALYTLARILSDVSGLHVFLPEGNEDLAIYDDSQRLIEVVQVKDYSNPLALSDFKPGSPQGFFARVVARRRSEPSCRTSIATFGPLGPELLGAVNGNTAHRDAVARKLNEANPPIATSEAFVLLESLRQNIVYVAEDTLRGKIIGDLAGTIAGGHQESTLEMLLFWIFDASEKRLHLTRRSLLSQLETIGAYLAALRDSSSEWMTAVVPVSDETLSDEELLRLRTEYRQGVQATWRHILADADCARPIVLKEIHKKLQSHAVVVLRGASGQGKSSLGWRYLRDFAAGGLRFHVRFVEGNLHASRVANALRAHVRSLNLSPIVYLDLAPSDTGWLELVRQLSQAGLKVLVTVREEDYRRAGVPLGEIDIAEVALDGLSNVEARDIFAALTTEHHSSALDFDDAWLRFNSNTGGPLLEFAYLVVQGESLPARVTSQIQRIQIEVGSAAGPLTQRHLHLLALCAVAHAAECRVDLGRLCEAVGLDPLSRPLAFFEREYMLRVTAGDQRASVTGLHPIRSKAIESTIFLDFPESWIKFASELLPLLVDEDIETFLLAAYSNRPQHSAPLAETLATLNVRSWTQAGGIARALLWEGLSRFERANHATLASAIKNLGTPLMALHETLFGAETAMAGLLATFAEQAGVGVPKVVLTPREDIFIPLCEWAAQVAPPETTPTLSTEWVGAGDLAFWLGTRQVKGPLRARLEQLLPVDLAGFSDLTALAAFVSGHHALGTPQYLDWHATHQPEIVRWFVLETESVYVEDDGHEVKVFFPIMSAPRDTSVGASDFHGQTMKRLDLLKQLFPQREVFGAQSLGLEVLGELAKHDPTTKKIPAENLPAHRIVHLNATLLGLVTYRHLRADTWQEYVNAIVLFRCVFREHLNSCSETT